MFNRLGGRKLLFTLLAVGVGVTVDLCTDRGLSPQLKDLLIYVGAIYTAGNIGTKTAEALRARNEAKGAQSQDKVNLVLDQVQQEMLKLNQNQELVYGNLHTNTQATAEILNRIAGGSRNKGTQNV